MINQIPDIVIGRLPMYLRALTYLQDDGAMNTSSHELGRRLGISSAQIRKDLSHFGEFGKQGTGYNIQYLLDQLRQILNLEKEWPVAIIGGGHLGRALAHYQGFQQRGFCMAWVFDADKSIVGEQFGGMTIQHISELPETVTSENIEMAIIAVPAHAAQEVCDLAIEAGIKAILNYAPINLLVPEGIEIRTSDPVIKMQHMTYYLSRPNDPVAYVNGVG